MSRSELNQLSKAEKLFDNGKLEEAFEIFNDESQFEGLELQQKSHFQFLKGLILIYQNRSEDLIKFGKEIFEEKQKNEYILQSLDGMFFIAVGLDLAFKFDEALEWIEKYENLLNQHSQIPHKDYILQKARIYISRGLANLELGKVDLAERCLEWSLKYLKNCGDTFEIVWANLIMSRVMYQGRREVDLSFDYIQKALSIAKKIKFNHFWIAFCHLFLGVFYYEKCEFDKCLKHNNISLEIFRETNNYSSLVIVLNNLGALYIHKGDYKNSIKCLEECLELSEKQFTSIMMPLANLIELYLDIDKVDLAQKYFERLEKIYHQKKGNLAHLIYSSCKALILKRSSRIRDKAEAEKLLKEVIKSESIWFEIVNYAIIHLCDLLLSEYQINNSKEVLEEINSYISQLISMAENQHSYSIFCETFILQAKLALVNFDMKAARLFLTQAQKIAESYGIKRFAKKISYEHDNLLKQLKIWETLKESESSISERWKLAGLKEQMEKMVRKKIDEIPKLKEEEPVLLIVISEGGVNVLFHSFVKEKKIESQIFGGLLTTIDYFIREMFSEGLDRAIFGDYTLIMKSLTPFYVSYIFKGDSYYALQKINYFKDYIGGETEIWQNLLKYFQRNQTIQLRDIPQLESFITKLFITKKIAFD